VLPASELIAKLDAVDAGAVRRFGARVMASPRPAMAAVGPLKNLERYETFANRFGAGATRRAAE
jgi:hypothetical protein